MLGKLLGLVGAAVFVSAVVHEVMRHARGAKHDDDGSDEPPADPSDSDIVSEPSAADTTSAPPQDIEREPVD